jgi:hypothetical protein
MLGKGWIPHKSTYGTGTKRQILSTSGQIAAPPDTEWAAASTLTGKVKPRMRLLR